MLFTEINFADICRPRRICFLHISRCDLKNQGEHIKYERLRTSAVEVEYAEEMKRDNIKDREQKCYLK